MANQRSTFAKRSREMKLKDSAKAKVERREARKSQKSDTKGPSIAWDQPGGVDNAAMTDDDSDAPPAVSDPAAPPAPDGATPSSPSSPSSGTQTPARPRSFDTSDVDR
jgi:hypothetical protein